MRYLLALTLAISALAQPGPLTSPTQDYSHQGEFSLQRAKRFIPRIVSAAPVDDVVCLDPFDMVYAYATGTQHICQPTTLTARTGVWLTVSGGDSGATSATIQSGAPLVCAGTGSAGVQTCTMTPTLTEYTPNMVVHYTPEDTNSTTQTINIDGLGAKSILKFNGNALDAGDLTATRQYPIWYDGTNFRLPGGPIASVSGGTNVLCTTTTGDVACNTIDANIPTKGGSNAFTGANDFSGASSFSTPPLATQGAGYKMIPMDHLSFSNGQDSFSNNVATPLYTQFQVDSPMTIRAIELQLTGSTASASNGTAFAIMDSACNKVTNGDATTTIFNGSTGIKRITFPTPPTLQRGAYFLGFATEVAGQTWIQFNPSTYWLNLVNEASYPRHFKGATAATGTGLTLALPSACGAKTAESTNFPLSAVLLP